MCPRSRAPDRQREMVHTALPHGTLFISRTMPTARPDAPGDLPQGPDFEANITPCSLSNRADGLSRHKRFPPHGMGPLHLFHDLSSQFDSSARRDERVAWAIPPG